MELIIGRDAKRKAHRRVVKSARRSAVLCTNAFFITQPKFRNILTIMFFPDFAKTITVQGIFKHCFRSLGIGFTQIVHK